MDVATLGVKELRAFIKAAGLTTEGCIDKADLLERAVEAQAVGAGPDKQDTNPDSAAIEASISELGLSQVVDMLEEVLALPPSQVVARKANACLERVTLALMEGEANDEVGAARPPRLAAWHIVALTRWGKGHVGVDSLIPL